MEAENTSERMVTLYQIHSVTSQRTVIFIIVRGPEINLAPNVDVGGLAGFVYNMGWLVRQMPEGNCWSEGR
jgi:hypothetical protein